MTITQQELDEFEEDRKYILRRFNQIVNENKTLKAHISDIDPNEIVKYQDIDHLLEAIGAERVGKWFMGLGSR